MSERPPGQDDLLANELEAYLADTRHGRRAEIHAFIAGAKWWEFTSTGFTMWPSDQRRAWEEAIHRYLTRQPDAQAPEPSSRKEPPSEQGQHPQED